MHSSNPRVKEFCKLLSYQQAVNVNIIWSFKTIVCSQLVRQIRFPQFHFDLMTAYSEIGSDHSVLL